VTGPCGEIPAARTSRPGPATPTRPPPRAPRQSQEQRGAVLRCVGAVQRTGEASQLGEGRGEVSTRPYGATGGNPPSSRTRRRRCLLTSASRRADGLPSARSHCWVTAGAPTGSESTLRGAPSVPEATSTVPPLMSSTGRSLQSRSPRPLIGPPHGSADPRADRGRCRDWHGAPRTHAGRPVYQYRRRHGHVFVPTSPSH
jgi:hypothetical protein